MTCRHCRDPGRTVNRPRGLCWTCYYTPGVRDRYQSESKYGRRGVGHGGGGFGLPAAPTSFAPGTAGKLAVLEGRAANKVALWHPLDARYEGDPRPLLSGAAAPDGADAMAERTLFARPAKPLDMNSRDVALGRTVLLGVPGELLRLTPAEALRLAEQLRGAVDQLRAEADEPKDLFDW